MFVVGYFVGNRIVFLLDESGLVMEFETVIAATSYLTSNGLTGKGRRWIAFLKKEDSYGANQDG